MRHYHHLSIEEREKLLEYKSKGYSQGQIAMKMKRSKSTISRELSRNEAEYSPSKAQKRYCEKRKNSVRRKRLETHPELRD